MSNEIKGKGQRLIPEELLKYLQAVKNTYPEALEIVTANPTLEGGEDSLSSVLINGTKYAVGGGGSNLLSDIVDANGNSRFIEGEGMNGAFTNVTYVYNKWSLSGTHLMLVTIFKVNAQQDFSANTAISEFSVPQFILDKISNISTNIVLRKKCDVYVNDAVAETIDVKLIKGSITLRIDNASYLLLNAGDVRIQIDLLIDSDYE